MPRPILFILFLALTPSAHAQEPAVPPDLPLEVMSFNLRYGTAKDGEEDHESPESRRRSAELLVGRIQQRDPKDPVLVTGDLNAGPASPPVRILEEVVRDTWGAAHGSEEGGGTFHGFRGGREGQRIDYVFAGPAWQVMGASIIRGRYAGGWPSDHYPVTARIRPLPARGGRESPDGR